jgi:hypothetical protein
VSLRDTIDLRARTFPPVELVGYCQRSPRDRGVFERLLSATSFVHFAKGWETGPPTARDFSRTLYSYLSGLSFHSYLLPINLLVNPSQNHYLLRNQ